MTENVAPVVCAFGEPDDHLRMVIELARGLRLPDGDPVYRPQQPWESRLEGLEDRLRNEPRALHLVDLDALIAGQRERDRWDDWDFSRQRRELLDVLLRSMGRGRRWILSRPEPTPELTAHLPMEADELEDEKQGDVADWIALAPALRPMARALVDQGHVGEERLLDILDAAEDPGAVLLSVSHDTLPRPLRGAAARLAIPRGRQGLNGTVGPFAWSENVTREHVAALAERGWVQRENGAYSMGRSVRHFLLSRAPSHELRDGHASAAEGSHDDLARHHHALEAGDAELAIETATFYGVDLRLLARRRSVLDGEFADAARLYRVVVDRFDDTDAYAWEYYAYNLARSSEHPSEPEQARILEAYAKACELDRRNPLYRGRWFAFRARTGQRIAPELLRYVRSFAQPQFSANALSYLCERPLRELKALGRHDELAEIRDKAPRELSREPKLSELLQS